MRDYRYFLTESKSHFDSFERNRLHTKHWEIRQKLRLLDTARAMEFFLPFYSATGRPAKNQPQILKSFSLFFFLYSEDLARPSLTLWVDRPKGKHQKAQETKQKITESIEKLHMKPNGYDKSSGYLMWRCPYGKEHCSKCKNSCTDSRYGRGVKTRPDWDIRLYTDVPRDTDAL